MVQKYTKWNVVPTFTLYHLYTTDLRHPTNTVNRCGVPTFLTFVLFVGNGVLFFLQTLQ